MDGGVPRRVVQVGLLVKVVDVLHKEALALGGARVALGYQLPVRAVDGVPADVELLLQSPDGGERLVFDQVAVDDAVFELGVDLLVERQ